jgi:Xaa-Pro dipeptidase
MKTCRGSTEEVFMSDRLEVLMERLAEQGADCAVIGPTTTMRYLLGDTPVADERLCVLLVTPERVQMIAPSLNADQISAFTDVAMLTWEDAAGPGGALSGSILAGNAPNTLAVDGSMRADFLLPVLEQAHPRKIIPLDPVVAQLRMLKSDQEIAALAAAAAQADRAMAAAVDACRPGATEADVAWAAERAFREDGAEGVEFTLVAAGCNAAFPHHHSGDEMLREGEGIIIDIGASLHGYKSDITRMVFLGNPGKEFRKAFELVLAANTSGREAVRPGMQAEELDRRVRRVIEQGGMGARFLHRTGHGLGLDIHEEPWIQAGNTVPLAEGMVFSIEPGVYVPGKFGIRVEDIVAITPEGVKTLTGFEHELVVK